MHRLIALSMLAFPLVACGYETRAPEPADPAEPAPAAAPKEISGDTSGVPEAPAPPETCGAEGQYAVAPAGAPVCSADVACDADAACAHLPGTYCEPAFCAFAGCLRGACLLTRVMGEACSRDGECVSGKCDCASQECVCAPQPEEGSFQF